MANCNTHFKEYNGKIRLTQSRREDLKGSRKGLRQRVTNWFKENKPDEEQPRFESQGSMLMDTIINPIPRTVIENGEEKKKLHYDVDDGIYFDGDKDENDRQTPATYHSWVCQAVDGHTDTPPIDKNTCVRTVFADGHHIDQPIYYKQGNMPELAHKRDGYIKSDPDEFTTWFNDRADKNTQLRRLVRYGKGWCDNRNYKDSSKKMPSGMVMTILITENVTYRENRDDIALKETLINIRATLRNKFACYRPTTPKGENLLADYTQKDYFLDCLDNFIDDAKKALQEKNFKKASELWREHLSDRFPLGEDKDDTSTNATASLGAIIPLSTKPYAE